MGMIAATAGKDDLISIQIMVAVKAACFHEGILILPTTHRP